MIKLIHKLTATKYSKGLASFVGSSAVGQGVAFLCFPILTRLYTPEAMGQLGLIVAFISFLSISTSLRYEISIVTAKSNILALRLALLSIIISVPMSALSGIIFLLLTKYKIFGFGTLPTFLTPLITLAIFITTFAQILKFFSLKIKNYNAITYSNFTQNTTRAGVQVLLGFMHIGYLGLFFGDLAGRFVGIQKMLSSFVKNFRNYSNVFDSKKLRLLAHKNKVYPLYVLPSSIIDILAYCLIVPILVQTYGIAAAGFYSLASRIISIPISLISGNVADIFYSQISDCAREDYRKIKSTFLTTARNLFFVGLFPAIILVICALTLLDTIFGQHWHDIGYITAIMIPWGFFQFVVSPVSRIVFVVGGQKFKLIYDFAALISGIVGIYIGWKLHFTLLITIATVSFLHCISYVLYFIILLYLTNKFIKKMGSVKTCAV